MNAGIQDALELADKLMQQMKRPFVVDGMPLSLGFSVGIAIYPRDGETPEMLIANADVAMYKAKQQGRSRAELYEADEVVPPTQAAAQGAA